MLDLLRGPSWFDRSTITVILVCTVLTLGMVQFRKNKFNPKGQHCYIGGGSQGLGLALGCLLASRGAHVTIVSRSQKKLDEALEKIETFRTSPSQKFASLAYDLSSVEGAEDAMDAAAEPFDGKVPDHVFSCTGGAAGILGFFIELTPEQLKHSVDVNYWTAVWTARAAGRRMAKQGVRGSIVLTSSVLGFFAIPGYSAYTAIKHAIRGLAESLRIEFLLYNINVHCYFPATIYSPGFEEEQKSKPELTKIIEGADEGLTPEDCALRLVRGIEKGHVMITSDPIGHLFRNSMRGMSPVSNYILDPIFAAIAPIGIPIWRKITEYQIRSHIPKHQKEVVDRLS
ncbi:hypothetical protein Pst134EA_000972 [Puccinia striiformis f. sp. tritici]|uniref:hypothetical protein n=1 Tax=Puccinia striiformis f. sp. tritici TaxID=168172 RepID=UPI0020084A06|nr:hypothetical protein Pst134EA_000972 [Puccinia striiformis f. sp. tritici]KAH9473916.1 hypothetical protein Pst134EA_000972 [Puccinia striiformis f. sp. tritici]